MDDLGEVGVLLTLVGELNLLAAARAVVLALVDAELTREAGLARSAPLVARSLHALGAVVAVRLSEESALDLALARGALEALGVHLLAADMDGFVDERLVTGAAISGHEGLRGRRRLTKPRTLR
eukprot:Mycagemm_TRINITY_DN10385_c0_g3::TRINITY_DN10385_c0_g3_i1::g.1399::m.1399 type:complete len:124 gc:universal TRINITY_DN10385_c0_g3_i1:196-567(+)